jgi:hypothetical protein
VITSTRILHRPLLDVKAIHGSQAAQVFHVPSSTFQVTRQRETPRHGGPCAAWNVKQRTTPTGDSGLWTEDWPPFSILSCGSLVARNETALKPHRKIPLSVSYPADRWLQAPWGRSSSPPGPPFQYPILRIVGCKACRPRAAAGGAHPFQYPILRIVGCKARRPRAAASGAHPFQYPILRIVGIVTPHDALE